MTEKQKIAMEEWVTSRTDDIFGSAFHDENLTDDEWRLMISRFLRDAFRLGYMAGTSND